MLGAALVSAILGRGGGGLGGWDAIEAGLSKAGEMRLKLGSQSLLWSRGCASCQQRCQSLQHAMHIQRPSPQPKSLMRFKCIACPSLRFLSVV